MYGPFTYICPINDPNVSKYTIYGAYGYGSYQLYHGFSVVKTITSSPVIGPSPQVVPGAVAVAPKPHTPHGLGPTATLAGLAMA